MTNDAKTLDPTKLMGFESVKDLGSLDFSDDAMASRVGAKVGVVEPVIQPLDLSRLLGFESLAIGAVDFTDGSTAARVGAKVGEPTISDRTIDAPQSFRAISGAINFADDAVAARLGAKIGEPTDRTR